MACRFSQSDSRWTVVALVALVLVVGCLVPSPFRRRPEFSRVGPDKFLHFLGHGSLAVALAAALRGDRPSRWFPALLAVGCSTTLGVVTGTLQRWVPGRKPELADLVAGFLGAVVGVGWWARTDPSDSRSITSHRVTRRRR